MRLALGLNGFRFRSLSALASLFALSFAQADDSIEWVQVAAQANLGAHWQAYLEVQPRWEDGFGESKTFLVRPAVFYRLNDRMRWGVGYVHQPEFRGTKPDENRAFQQIDVEWYRAVPLHGKLRLRTEERFFDGDPKVHFRFRALLKGEWMPAGSSWGVYAFDEILFHFTDSATKKRGWDQNRFSIGPRYKEGPWVVELGYLLQTVNSSPIARHHGGFLNILYAF
jgi:hypothetical protein